QPESGTKLESASKIETEAKPEKSALPDQSPDSSVEAFVAKLDSATRAIHANSKKDPNLIRDGCRELLQQILDLDAMAKDVNVDLWEKMTPTQRETFRAAFEHRMVSRCVKQIGAYDGESMQLLGVRAHNGVKLATVRVGSSEDGKQVTWRLRH